MRPPTYYNPGNCVGLECLVFKSVNLGAMGNTIAHELSHGFDKTGSYVCIIRVSHTGSIFNEHGLPWNWWTADTKHAFKIRSDCLAEQFSLYKHVNGICVFVWTQLEFPCLGRQTLDENIADAAGVRIAFREFMSVLQAYDGGFDFNFVPEKLKSGSCPIRTLEQLFFLSRGHSFGCKRVPKLELYEKDPHTIGICL